TGEQQGESGPVVSGETLSRQSCPAVTESTGEQQNESRPSPPTWQELPLPPVRTCRVALCLGAARWGILGGDRKPGPAKPPAGAPRGIANVVSGPWVAVEKLQWCNRHAKLKTPYNAVGVNYGYAICHNEYCQESATHGRQT
ncbi:unnamed protein product, partial [Heterosigma akashiwo]